MTGLRFGTTGTTEAVGVNCWVAADELCPDTAWRVAHQACEGGVPGLIGWELAAQGVVGPGADQRLMDVARKYAIPIQ